MELEFGSDRGLKTYRNILNFLSDSSDDYFFLWDIPSGRLYFSGNIREHFALMAPGAEFCTLADWAKIVYPRDLAALEADLVQIRNGKRLVHNMEYRLMDRSGDVVWISCRGKCHQDDLGLPLWMIGRVSDRVVSVKTDRLTGAFSMDVLKEDLDRILQDQEDGFLLLVGVDGLKSVNVKHGRAFGDQLLKQTAAALEDAASGARRIYRMNGDCFAATLPGLDDQGVEEVFRQTQKRLEGKCTLSGGCVPFREYRVPDGETLYQYAENSLDRAKAQGRNRLWFFSADDYEKDLAALELKEELRQSVQNGFEGFSLCYQTQVALHTFRLQGAEALLRYQSPRRGNVSPQEFVPILEQSGLICPVGQWVLTSALSQCRAWREQVPDMRVSVNMSYHQLRQPDIAEQVLHALGESGLPGEALTIEVTESMQLLDYPALNDIFRQWKERGIQISVDDFGTGYSSLGRLKQLEVDEIKIDRCFISNIQHSAYNYHLLSNMLELAESSQIRVCCEGMETEEELAVLEELRPALLQGFLFSHPVPPGEFEALYIRKEGTGCQEALARARVLRAPPPIPEEEWPEEELIQAIMETENDIFYVSDLETYELYYLSPAGQRLFGLRDYRGKKCYKALQGRDAPCPFCTNQHLKPDEFYIWDQLNEYCGRHFILKDKILFFRGKKVRLEVALDITKQEIMSQSVRERLNFAEKVVEYSRILSQNIRFDQAVQQVLALVGEFYQADRAYLFQPAGDGSWVNTFEWCGNGASPQIQNLQNVSPQALRRWMELFRRDRSVVILNLDTLRESSPLEWSILSQQGISRIVAVPLLINGNVIGFIGVDNPRYAIHDDSQIRVLSYFLVNRIRQDRSENRFQALLHFGYQNILNVIGVGLWIIRIHPQGEREMLADDTMYRVLGIYDIPSPQECYQFWYDRINDGYYHYVNQSVERMLQSGRVVQLEYTWRHPQRGEVVVRCTGMRCPDEKGVICLRGIHRIISDIERPQSLPEVHAQDLFEYNEVNKTIFFHSARTLLFGQALRESNFPQCWVDQEIVHPHFVQSFLSIFTRVRLKGDLEVPELMLKGKDGRYVWFRIALRPLGREKQDLDTVAVVLEPTVPQRMLELETLRIRGFYQVLLSETIAYAEVDLESGQLKSLGGLWQIYQQDYRQDPPHFIQILEDQLSPVLPPEELERLRRYRIPEVWQDMLERGEPSRRFYYRRPIDGRLRWVEMVIHIFREDTTQNAFALICLKDINAEKERELAQLEAASRDPLTHNYNRAAFEREVSLYIRCLPEGTVGPCGVLMLLDVDNFKKINDQLGHLEGDKALQRVSRLLTLTFRQQDIIGRLGGDEFLVFVKGYIDRAHLERRLERLLQRLEENDGHTLTSSIGVTFVQAEDFHYTHALKQADVALYHSKQNGKNGFCFYQDLGEEATGR